MSSSDHMRYDIGRYMDAPFDMGGPSSVSTLHDEDGRHRWPFRTALAMTPIVVWCLTTILTPDVVLRILADEDGTIATIGIVALGFVLCMMTTMIMDLGRIDHVRTNRVLGIASTTIITWMFALLFLGLDDESRNPYVRAKAPTPEQMSMLAQKAYVAPEVRGIIAERIVDGRLDRGAAYDILNGEPMHEAMRRVDERQAEYDRAVVLGR